jgi:hypothetical protein
MICGVIKNYLNKAIDTNDTTTNFKITAGVSADPSALSDGKGNDSNIANFSACFPIYKYSTLSKI